MANRRVMIVDSSLYSRMVLTGILASHGYSVCAETGSSHDVMSRYGSARPDFVLIDANMPDKDGIVIIRELCREFDGCRALLCASSGQRAMVCEALAAGAMDFIPKPYNERTVVRTLLRAAMQIRTSP